MSDPRERAHDDFMGFVNRRPEYRKVFMKYATVSDEFKRIQEKVDRYCDRGKAISERDRDEYIYYNELSKMLALVIADHTLEENGYERDDDGFWL